MTVRNTSVLSVAILFVIMAYRAAALRGLAVAQMVFGALMVAFGVASVFAVDHWSSYVGFGIWVGVWVSIDHSRTDRCTSSQKITLRLLTYVLYIRD